MSDRDDVEYFRRPFHSVGEMNAVLVAYWNSVVGPNDTVHVLGNVAMDRREESMPHVHEKWRQQGRMVNVRVDVWGFAPIAEETIARVIDKPSLASG